MSAGRPLRRSATVELALWCVVILAGAGVLLPALVDWVQARRAEAETERAAEQAAERLAEQNRRLWWLVHDPQRDEKLRERYAIEDRNPAQ